MTVKELVDTLSKMPQDARVFFLDDGDIVNDVAAVDLTELLDGTLAGREKVVVIRCVS